jgi:hypothetical protein
MAELQNVKVGGEVVILGEYYRNVATPGTGLRWPAEWLLGRPIGTGIGAGNGIFCAFGFDAHGPGWSGVTQWTRLHVDADFTDDVRAFIEFDGIEEWGEDLRSDWVTGADGRASSVDDIEVYQAYVEANAMFGRPLRVRIGRQELSFGSEWLVGPNTDGPAPAWGLSFDAVRLTHATETWSVDAWWSKLFENGAAEEDGDTDFYGVYASCQAVDNMVFDAYWMWLRDARALKDTNLSLVGEWVEDLVGVDDYDPSSIHTVGFRAAGEIGAFDLEAEVAYQWGAAGQVGFLFKPLIYGDDDADYDAWACNLELGYTFDAAWQPRVYLAYAYFEGEDNRDISFGDWLAWLFNPFYARDASVSFNRLFSNWSYSAIMDGSEKSNAHFFHTGVQVAPTDSLEVALDIGYYLTDEPFSAPIHWDFGKVFGNYRLRVPLFPGLSFLNETNDDELGWEVDLSATYYWSEDLYFSAGWAHLFVGDGLSDGNFVTSNGSEFIGGSDGDDADYFWFETGVSF